MSKQTIVLMEDDEDIIALLSLQASLYGYTLIPVSDGVHGLAAVEEHLPDVVLLDIMLPGQNGMNVCRKMKGQPSLAHIPIIMISAKSEESDIVTCLELGADDYVTKPFSPKILFSRIKAVLRRHKEEESSSMISFGEYLMDVEKYIVQKGGEEICLTRSEFDILKRLATSGGKVLTRNQLLDDIAGDDAFIVDRNIDVHIAALRKKLGPLFSWIETVRGVGYRFRTED